MTPLLSAGLVATCAALDLEALYGARNAAGYQAISADRHRAYEYVPTLDEDWQQALAVRSALATTGRWRAAGLAALVIAAVAARARLAVLHYDADYEVIASVSGQPVEWVVPRGSVP